MMRQNSQAARQKMENLDVHAREVVERNSTVDACTKLLLARPRDYALYLDVDGTLIDLATTPHGVAVPAGLIDCLRTLSACFGGALAIITGRRVAEIDNILSPIVLPASGVHGAELRLSSGEPVTQLMPSIPSEMVDQLSEIVRRTPGVLIEPKGPGLAIHYRLAPNAAPLILRNLEGFLQLYPDRFAIYPGQRVFEIIPTGFSKASGLTSFAQTDPFKGRIPIMIGDDIGDEPAFAMARQLSGYGLRVASENFGVDDVEFSGPQAVRNWLASLATQWTLKA
jgi:trehalose 6-phosphate phosphatase